MIKKILVDDWRANWMGKRFVKLEKCDERLVNAVRKLEENLPENVKLKIIGIYNCGYGISMQEEDYDMSLEISEKKLFPKSIYQLDFLLKKDLNLYGKDDTSTEIYNSIMNDFKEKLQS